MRPRARLFYLLNSTVAQNYAGGSGVYAGGLELEVNSYATISSSTIAHNYRQYNNYYK